MQPDPHARHLGAYVWLFVILALAIALAYVFRFGHPRTTPLMNSDAKPADAAAVTNPAQGAPQPTAQDLVTAQHGFDYLVQYNGGFHPSTLAIKKGETVRFTNNSAQSISISGASRASDTLVHGQYWEFTADKAGTFSFTANGTTMTLIVR